jgi:glucose dehydrogenase
MKSISQPLFIAAFFLSILIACNSKKEAGYNNWSVYGGNKENNRYSSLTQIDTSNVTQLQVAWQYHTGDSAQMTQIQVNPIIIDNILYGVSPKLKLFAVDAATGKEKWVFDPVSDPSEVKGAGYFMMNVCRGVSYYKIPLTKEYFIPQVPNFFASMQKLESRSTHLATVAGSIFTMILE